MEGHEEFFRLVLGQIKEIYFDNGLRVMLREKYVTIGIILGKFKNLVYFTLLVMRKKMESSYANKSEQEISDSLPITTAR